MKEESRNSFWKVISGSEERNKGGTNKRIVEGDKTRRVKDNFVLIFCARLKDAGEIIEDTRLQRNLGVRREGRKRLVRRVEGVHKSKMILGSASYLEAQIVNGRGGGKAKSFFESAVDERESKRKCKRHFCSERESSSSRRGPKARFIELENISD
ncbi:hypothetical protein GLOIN_2v1484454 [Rhizophagus irregularis DAOM 181602=DAOM 197198]|uniref:Uncharacterized protein n=1 Tax=Rhizophagus irregularis (strain DAOM 181602 / DAOM 197198 / MUCL 43194) TaxID=747089 RepID=A0A2P4PEE1_RHIID|nr:hypothetical protein GLOIN_2v1484454 [Rhizophagus irregularis DAOM 181602=DAOM 197198]POG63749.1 hypothetical protein GLOIN_2v1484454 [Rhizophagus irregularis DAOM 181602=DAOM 197198]|eukprot:XP_025170615.1 hypothetical protein GLOIN_2v1484454 [Rhizophagus irregularis DAOM 181602=DAOM 197198]